MKKLLIFALLLLPMTTFAASSVRVLGAKPATATGTTTATTASSSNLMRAAKPAAAKTAGATTARIGSVSSKAKKPTGTLTGSTTTTSSGSRFPVITPAHSYNTVTKPQSGTTTVVQKEYVDTVDDPRFDMIRVYDGSPRPDWVERVGNSVVQDREGQNYVFMWIEE